MKLLLVEDHQINQQMFARRLTSLGYEVVTASDGQEAVDLAQEHLPALILMDLSLPVIDGWEATRQIRCIRSTRHIPVIALTAFVHEYDRESALAAGCNDYQTKPVDMDELIRKITALTEARH